MKDIISLLNDKYGITTEVFYLKNIKRGYFLDTYIMDNEKHKYKRALEKFKIINNEIYPLSDIINRDIVIKMRYIDGIIKSLTENILIPIKEKDMLEQDLNIPEKYIEMEIENNEEERNKYARNKSYGRYRK